MSDGLFKNSKKYGIPAELNRYKGKIIHVEKNGGWGFITSPEIPFTRIFFHWTALQQDTLNFIQLEKNMQVEFTLKIFDANKHRAIKIKVVEDESTGVTPDS